MSDDDLERHEIICERCGTRNPAGEAYCVTCGTPLDDATPAWTVIDVSSDRPRIITVEEDITHEGPFGGVRTIRFEQGRVVVARGGSTICLLILAVIALLLGCVCWAIWTTVGSIF